MDYIYHGDKMTSPEFKKKPCKAVRKPNGKCYLGKNSNMLVEFENGKKCVIMARTLRKIKKIDIEAQQEADIQAIKENGFSNNDLIS